VLYRSVWCQRPGLISAARALCGRMNVLIEIIVQDRQTDDTPARLVETMTSHSLHRVSLPTWRRRGHQGHWLHSGRYQIELTTRHAILMAPWEMSERLAACCSLRRHAPVLTLRGFSARRTVVCLKDRTCRSCSRLHHARDRSSASPHRSSITTARLRR
jgi:hypothetical protein